MSSAIVNPFYIEPGANRSDYQVDDDNDELGWDDDDDDRNSDLDGLVDHPGNDFDSYNYTSRRRRRPNNPNYDEDYGHHHQGVTTRTKCVVLIMIIVMLVLISVSDRGPSSHGGRFDPIVNETDVQEERNFTNETEVMVNPAGNETMGAGETERNFTNETDAAVSTDTADSGEPNDKVDDKTKEGMAKQTKSTTLEDAKEGDGSSDDDEETGEETSKPGSDTKDRANDDEDKSKDSQDASKSSTEQHGANEKGGTQKEKKAPKSKPKGGDEETSSDTDASDATKSSSKQHLEKEKGGPEDGDHKGNGEKVTEKTVVKKDSNDGDTEDSASSADGTPQESESDTKAMMKHSKKTKKHMKAPKAESDTEGTMKHKKTTKHKKSSSNKIKRTKDQEEEDPTTRLLS